MTSIPTQIFASPTFDLCSYPTDNATETSYFAKNQTSQKCGCETCLKRCCKPGFVYRKQFCHRELKQLLNVSIYTAKTTFVKKIVNIGEFEVGLPPDCPNGMFRVNSSIDKFYVQTDHSVWVPKYQKYYEDGRYCLDSSDGITLFLCFKSEKKVKYFAIGELTVLLFSRQEQEY